MFEAKCFCDKHTHTNFSYINWIWLHSPHEHTAQCTHTYTVTTSDNLSIFQRRMQHDKQQKWKILMISHRCGMNRKFAVYSKRLICYTSHCVKYYRFWNELVNELVECDIESIVKWEWAFSSCFIYIARNCLGKSPYSKLFKRLYNMIFNARFLWYIKWFNKYTT